MDPTSLYKIKRKDLKRNSHSSTKHAPTNPRAKVPQDHSVWPTRVRPEDVVLCVDDVGEYLVVNVDRQDPVDCNVQRGHNKKLRPKVDQDMRVLVCLTEQSAGVAEKYARFDGHVCTFHQLRHGADAPAAEARPVYWSFDSRRKYLCVERVQRREFVEIELRIAYVAVVPDDAEDLFLWIRNYRTARRGAGCRMTGIGDSTSSTR